MVLMQGPITLPAVIRYSEFLSKYDVRRHLPPIGKPVHPARIEVRYVSYRHAPRLHHFGDSHRTVENRYIGLAQKPYPPSAGGKLDDCLSRFCARCVSTGKNRSRFLLR